MDDERSAAGDPIYHHERLEGSPRIAGNDPELIEAVADHVTEHFGAHDLVWHELVSFDVHVDIHVVEPTDERPVYTLVTSGMSQNPMPGAPDADRSYAELTMLLPPTWPKPNTPEFRDERAYWPYELLQELAGLPHAYDTWLWKGQTVSHGDPPEPYARDTKLCGALIAPTTIAPDGFEMLHVGVREIHFFAVIPLHADEMAVKLDQGVDALYDLMDEAQITEELRPDRPSVVPRRRRGLFGRR